jgi:hypothetical protein
MRFFLAVLLLPISSTSAFAHALNVDCSVRGKRVEVEAFYDGNEPARKAVVTVYDREMQVVYNGFTDHEGKWDFARPKPGKYTVKVADTGHRAEQEIEVTGEAESEPTVAPPSPREDGVPWLKIAIGFGVIGALSGAFLLASRFRKSG